MESILTSIKKKLGIDEACTDFDDDVIMEINSVLMTLNQLGVGPDAGYIISSSEQTWDDFLGTSQILTLEAVKTYVYLTVKLVFDPPTNSTLLEAMKHKADEYEWRIKIQAEKGDE